MKNVASDLFHHNGKTYLALVDRFSGYLLAEKLNSTSTTAITNKLSNWFNHLGWPSSIRTDGGPQFQTEFNRFCETKCIQHELSPAYHPQANGLAEAAVKNAKYLLIKCEANKQDYQYALYQWRNMPRQDGYSPAEMLFGRRQTMNIPTLPVHHLRPVNPTARDNKHKENVNRYNLRSRNAKVIEEEEVVWLQNPKTRRWDSKATVNEKLSDNRFRIKLPNGKESLRSRCHLKHIANP